MSLATGAKKSLQPFIGSGISKVAGKDLEAWRFLNAFMSYRNAVFGDWGGMGIGHGDGLA